MKKKYMEYRKRVIKCLQEAGGTTLWVREIARRTKIPATTVSLILDELYTSGLIVDEDLARDTGGKLKLRMVRLK